MKPCVTFAGVESIMPRHRAGLNVHYARVHRSARVVAVCVLTLCFTGGTCANGQTPSSSASTQVTVEPQADDTGAASATMPSYGGYSGAGRDAATGRTSPGSRTALPSDQIINILQESPDLGLELKSQVADRMQRQGVQIEPDDISDQMLYTQIAKSADLRANITTVLRARGYVSDEDLQSAGPPEPEYESIGSQLSAQQSLLMSGGIEDRSASSVRLGEGLAGFDAGAESMSMTPSQKSQRDNLRGLERANASTDAPHVLHQPTPYDLQSMRDLYTQIPEESTGPKRFGSDVFVNRGISAVARGISGRDTPLDVPLGPDYIVGPGDTLTIHLWGGITESIPRTIGRDGSIFLPEAGSVDIGGLSLGKAEAVIESALKQQYRNAHVSVTVSHLRSVRVYVVGDVQRPGGYDISSLSTPVSALYAAGGPTAAGSLRTLLHLRGSQRVESVDLYDFLLHGVRNGSAPFESGDTLLVPPAGPLVAVSGAVKRPAIYELKTGATTLATVIDDAGGFTSTASLGHIRIERIDTNHKRETVTLPDAGGDPSQADSSAIASFTVNDGDRIRVEPILPYSQSAVYLAGHVMRPGRLPYTDGMHLSDVLRSYQDMLPEPAAHGEIVRLVPPDLHAETIDFNVPDLLVGNANVDLQPYDTIRVFGRYQVDAPTVTIRGEVLRPGKFPMSKGMTAAQLVRIAGGFKRDALTESADLTSYNVKNGNELVESLATVAIGAAVDGSDPRADVPLKPGDILAIHQITNWENIGESVNISGEVRFPGSYGFQDGERLSSVLRRAGGLLPTAYPMGAVLVRAQVRELEQKSRDELIHQIETNAAAARLSPNLGGANSAGALQMIKEQQEQVLSDLKAHPPTGRMVIHISADVDRWANTPADIELRRGDELTIPKRPGFVLVSGQVYNATALTFTPGRSAGWYLSRAGGTNATANRREIFIIGANGSVIGRRSGSWFEGDVLSTKLNPGDVVVVPQKIVGGSLFWRNLLTAGQLAASIAFTSGVAVATL